MGKSHLSQSLEQRQLAKFELTTLISGIDTEQAVEELIVGLTNEARANLLRSMSTHFSANDSLKTDIMLFQQLSTIDPKKRLAKRKTKQELLQLVIAEYNFESFTSLETDQDITDCVSDVGKFSTALNAQCTLVASYAHSANISSAELYALYVRGHQALNTEGIYVLEDFKMFLEEDAGVDDPDW